MRRSGGVGLGVGPSPEMLQLAGARWDITMPVPDRNVQPMLWYRSIRWSYGFVVELLLMLPWTVTRSDIERNTKWTSQVS
jgi:hypothetical protein